MVRRQWHSTTPEPTRPPPLHSKHGAGEVDVVETQSAHSASLLLLLQLDVDNFKYEVFAAQHVGLVEQEPAPRKCVLLSTIRAVRNNVQE